MKSNSAKNTETSHHSRSPFFSKQREGAFFADHESSEETFFQAGDFLQPKLTVRPPNDSYEQEADAVADRIVNRETTVPTPVRRPEEAAPAEVPLAETITPLAQRQPEEQEQPLQEKAAFESPGVMESAEEAPVQRKENGAAPAEVDEQLQRSKGGGDLLPPATQQQMESGFGADFSQVRVHTGADAVQMSRDLNAQAFTHGRDIFFNEGKFQPGTKKGDQLLAHELTHTVQQGRTKPSAPVQRAEGDDNQQIPDQNEFELPDGTIINTRSRQMILPTISLPEFKERSADRFPTIIELRQGQRSRTQQVDHWKEELRPIITTLTNTKLGNARREFGFGPGPEVNFFLKPAENDKPLRIFGTEASLIETFILPFWDEQADPVSFQVDHIQEDQLGGEDSIYNYELLEARANGSAGPTINAEVRRRIKSAIRAVRQDENQQAAFESAFPFDPNVPQDITRLKSEYEINFAEHEFTEEVNGNPAKHWKVVDIMDGHHINMLSVMSPAQLQEEGLSGSNPDRLLIFKAPGGGVPVEIPWGQDRPTGEFIPFEPGSVDLFAGSRVDVLGVSFNPVGLEGNGNVGFLRVQAFKTDNSPLQVGENTTFDWQLGAIPNLEYGGAIQRESVAASVRNSLRLPGLSPIEIREAYLDPEIGIMAKGQVLPTVPFIGDANIEIAIEGDNIRLRKLFETSDFDMPPPFQISGTSLEVFAGTEGLGIEGELNFEISRVGQGFLRGAASTESGFALAGGFDFDTELFDPARIEMTYEDNAFTIGGEIGIPRGKVRGINSATIQVTYSEGSLDASGEAELDVPGVERGTLSVNYSDDQFSIGGSFLLSGDIPGIRSGSIEAEVTRTEEGAYQVAAGGTAVPDIPGIDSSLSVAYNDGALTIEGTVSYERDLLSGEVEVGATNRVVGEDGQPTEEVADHFTVYGGGSLTLQLTPWLEARAGVRFLPNGEIEISGRIGLPSTVEVFPRRSFERNLFSIPTIEIPLFAIPLGPRSIGLVATINGGLDFSAGFGPGQLEELFGEVTYNPDHPEQTSLAGGGRFVIPADAGLTLRADLGLGVSIGIASLTGGIELAGTLGLEGEAAAAVDVNWSPEAGLALHAEGSIMVNPKFAFDVNLLARASLDLFFFDISEEWRYNLVSFEWGPDIQFGIIFPVDYVEGEPFDISFDDVDVITPDIDVAGMAKDIASDVGDDVF